MKAPRAHYAFRRWSSVQNHGGRKNGGNIHEPHQEKKKICVYREIFFSLLFWKCSCFPFAPNFLPSKTVFSAPPSKSTSTRCLHVNDMSYAVPLYTNTLKTFDLRSKIMLDDFKACLLAPTFYNHSRRHCFLMLIWNITCTCTNVLPQNGAADVDVLKMLSNDWNSDASVPVRALLVY